MKRFAFKCSCVYAIVNVMNGKRYIGSTMHFQNRVQMHKFHLRRGTHDNRHLQASWKKYGEDAFVFGIIEEVPVEQMIKQEQAFLDSAQPHVYNTGLVASAPTRGRKFISPMKGPKVSEETRQRMRDSVTRRWKERPFREWPDELKTRRLATSRNNGPRAAASNRGQKRSDETKAKLRFAWALRRINSRPHAA